MRLKSCTQLRQYTIKWIVFVVLQLLILLTIVFLRIKCRNWNEEYWLLSITRYRIYWRKRYCIYLLFCWYVHFFPIHSSPFFLRKKKTIEDSCKIRKEIWAQMKLNEQTNIRLNGFWKIYLQLDTKKTLFVPKNVDWIQIDWLKFYKVNIVTESLDITWGMNWIVCSA